jgi:hypothetical protein
MLRLSDAYSLIFIPCYGGGGESTKWNAWIVQWNTLDKQEEHLAPDIKNAYTTLEVIIVTPDKNDRLYASVSLNIR